MTLPISDSKSNLSTSRYMNIERKLEERTFQNIRGKNLLADTIEGIISFDGMYYNVF